MIEKDQRQSKNEEMQTTFTALKNRKKNLFSLLNKEIQGVINYKFIQTKS